MSHWCHQDQSEMAWSNIETALCRFAGASGGGYVAQCKYVGAEFLSPGLD